MWFSGGQTVPVLQFGCPHMSVLNALAFEDINQKKIRFQIFDQAVCNAVPTSTHTFTLHVDSFVNSQNAICNDRPLSLNYWEIGPNNNCWIYEMNCVFLLPQKAHFRPPIYTSDQNVLCYFIANFVFRISLGVQRRFWSPCAWAQADQNLRWTRMSNRMVFRIQPWVHHIRSEYYLITKTLLIMYRFGCCMFKSKVYIIFKIEGKRRFTSFWN